MQLGDEKGEKNVIGINRDSHNFTDDKNYNAFPRAVKTKDAAMTS